MVKEHIHTVIKRSLEKAELPSEHLSITSPAQEAFGDYATSIALQLAKQVKKNPMELAQRIVVHLETDDIVEKVEVMKPGFINVWIGKKFLQKNLFEITHTYGSLSTNSDKKIMIEFTDPNPFKEMHIGHLYSNTIGESLSRLLASTGAQIKRVCYQGDVGMHVAKSLWGLRKKMTEDGIDLEKLETLALSKRIAYMGQAYARGAAAYEDNEQIAQEIKDINYLVYASAQEVLKEKQGWEPQVDYKQYVKNADLRLQEIKNLYEHGRQWSLDYFEMIYKTLGTKFDYYFYESIVGEYGVQIVKEYLKKGVFEESDGAIIFPGDKYDLHTRVFINSLGLPTYEAKELGLAPTKYKQFPYDLSIIVTGNEINAYFKVLLKALSLTHPDLAEKTKHIGHGMVRLPEGKMSSRTGKILTAEWLLLEVKKHIMELMKENEQISSNDIEETSDRLAVAAIKYSFLRGSIGNDTAFDFDESLSLVGNSGPYLIYTYVRCKSVLNKNTVIPDKIDVSLSPNDEETAILRTLIKYPEVVQEAANNFAPNYITTYLYDLSQKYNLFYQKHPILKEENEFRKVIRLQITQATSEVLQNGLNLLGIDTVEKM